MATANPIMANYPKTLQFYFKPQNVPKVENLYNDSPKPLSNEIETVLRQKKYEIKPTDKAFLEKVMNHPKTKRMTQQMNQSELEFFLEDLKKLLK